MIRQSEIGVAIIGLGRAGMIHARNFSRRIRGARLEAVVDPDAGSLDRARTELSLEKTYVRLEDVLGDRLVDAVVVVTPTHLHRDIVVAAADAGKHVLCEKPMAMNVEECRAMISASERNGTKLQIGFMRRFDRDFVEAKKALDEGAIGELVEIRSLTHGPSVPQRWMYDIQSSNGPLAEVSSHDIDTMRWFTGSDFEEVYAVAANYRCPDAKDEFPDFYDTVIMTARFADGKQGVLDGAASVFYGYDARVELLGTRGIMFVGDVGGSSVRVGNPDGRIQRRTNASWRTLFVEAYEDEDRAFVESILEGTPPRVSGNDGLEAVRVVNAGNLSIRQRRIVKLEEV